MNEIQIVVSICIPGETEDENLYDQILLQKYSKRGLWFISGTISNNEPVKQSAKKIATEVTPFTDLYINKKKSLEYITFLQINRKNFVISRLLELKFM